MIFNHFRAFLLFSVNSVAIGFDIPPIKERVQPSFLTNSSDKYFMSSHAGLIS